MNSPLFFKSLNLSAYRSPSLSLFLWVFVQRSNYICDTEICNYPQQSSFYQWKSGPSRRRGSEEIGSAIDQPTSRCSAGGGSGFSPAAGL